MVLYECRLYNRPMRRLVAFLAVVAVACGLQHLAMDLTAQALTTYEMLFTGVGAATIIFMVAVVAAGPTTQTALPPAFERRAIGPAARCLVCNADSESTWVACAKCGAPYHTDCAKYLKTCAVYGCAKTAETPQLPPKPQA